MTQLPATTRAEGGYRDGDLARAHSARGKTGADENSSFSLARGFENEMTPTTARALTDILGTLIAILAARGILSGDDVLILAAIAERHAKQQ